MITITKIEYNDIEGSAIDTFLEKSVSIKNRLKRGEEIALVSLSLSVSFCNMVSISHFRTGDYDPAEYFNLVSPYDVSRMFSNANSVNIK